MAAHLRTQIRDAIKARLLGLQSTGSNVFTAPVYPREDAQLPALLLWTPEEAVGWAGEPEMFAPRQIGKTVRVKVAAIAKSTADLQSVLDQICLEVEIALLTPGFVPSGAKLISYLSTSIDAVSAEKPTGQAEMTFEVNLLAFENAPDVAL